MDKIDEVFSHIHRGQSVIMHAPGGYGKTYILMHLHRVLGAKLVLSAMTGSAAVGLGGCTMHSVFPGFMNGRHKKNYKYELGRLLQMEYLAIDEISMLDTETFAKLDVVAREVYKEITKKHPIARDITQPFAGLVLILTGDFLQVPPVTGSRVYKSHLYQQIAPIAVHLTVPYRFTDPTYADIMDRMRINKLTPDDTVHLRSRVFVVGELRDLPHIKIFATRKKVEALNRASMDKLPNHHVQIARDRGNCASLDDIMPARFEYCVGARVMLRVNFVDLGLANGHLGEIIECAPAHIVVRFDSGRIETFRPATVKRGTDRQKIERTQYPFIIAFAITIHKVQGMTFDNVIIDMDGIFGAGMAYVAMSRARSLAGLYIAHFNELAMSADPVVIDELGALDMLT